MRTKEPRLRVTRWLGDVPVEAECSSCANASFKVSEWNAGEPFHQPNRQRYQDILQLRFDQHLASVHGQKREDSHDGGENS